MKKNKMLHIVSLLGAISLFTTGCGTSKGALSTRVQNFAVKATDTAEIGQFYTPDIPSVTIDGKHAYVSVEATQGENKLFFNGDNALLVESFEDITITYTIAEGMQKLTETTTVTVTDTTDPYIVLKTLPKQIYRAAKFRYNNYIRIGDLSGELSESKIVITDQNGDLVESENGVLRLPEDSDVEEVTFSITAKDVKNNSAEKSFTLPVLPARYLTEPIVDFTSVDMTKVTPYGVGTSDVKVVTVDETTGKQAIEFKADTGGTLTPRGGKPDAVGTQYGVLIDCPAWIQEVADKAYVNVTFELLENNSNERGWNVINTAFYEGMTANKTALTKSGTTKTLSVNVANILTDGKLYFTVRNSKSHNDGTMGTLRLTDIEFCFAKVLYSDGGENKGVDVLTHLGLKENQIKDVKFTTTDNAMVDVTDLTAFKPTESGELTFTLTIDDFVGECQVSAEVVVYDSLMYVIGGPGVLNFNEILDIYHSYYDLTYTTESGVTTSITDKNEKRNQQPTENGTYTIKVKGTVTGGIIEGTTIYIDVNTVEVPKGTFGTPILDTLTDDDVTAYGTYTSDVSVVTIDETTGKKAIQFTSNIPKVAAGAKSGVYIDCPIWLYEVKDQAYVNVTMKVVEQSASVTGSGVNKRGWYVGSPALYVGRTPNNTIGIGGGSAETFTGATNVTQKREHTVPINLSSILTDDGKLCLTVETFVANTAVGVIQITDIEFCFGKVLYSNSGNTENTGVNLLSHLGLQASEIKSATFGGTEVADLTAFKPAQSGELTLIIQKNGYIGEYEATVDVLVYDSLTYTDTALNFNNILDINHNYYELYYMADGGEEWTKISNKNEKHAQAPTASGTYKVVVQGKLTGGLIAGTTIYIDVTVN